MISTEKPGSPAEILEHHGIKGMKWGVSKARTTARDLNTPRNKKIAKRVAIGVGVTAVAVGTAFVAHKLSQSGHNPLSASNLAAKQAGKIYVSHLSNAQWNQKISDAKKAASSFDEISARRMAKPGVTYPNFDLRR